MSISTKRNDARTQDAMRLALRALAARASWASVFFEERTDLVLKLGRDRTRALSITPSRGAALANDRGSIHIADPTLDELVQAAGGGSVPTSRGHEEVRIAGVEAIERRERVLLERIAAELGGHPDVAWALSLVAFHQDVWVSDEDGQIVVDRRQGCRAELKLATESGVQVIDQVYAPDVTTFPTGRITSALQRLQCGRRVRLATGPSRAVFAAGIGGLIVHELVGHALEGDVIRQHRTWVQGGLPKTSRTLRVEDDPRRGRAPWAIDDEGAPSRPVLLTDGDRVAGHLLDSRSAAALSTSSTGHGRRATYRDPIRPRMGCTFIHAGDDDPTAVVAETHAGVFVRRMVSGETDAVRGVATFVVTDADLLEGGRCTASVDPFVMEVRGSDVWSLLDRIGTDLVFDTCVGSCVRDGQPLAVSVGAPTIRLGVITVNC